MFNFNFIQFTFLLLSILFLVRLFINQVCYVLLDFKFNFDFGLAGSGGVGEFGFGCGSVCGFGGRAGTGCGVRSGERSWGPVWEVGGKEDWAGRGRDWGVWFECGVGKEWEGASGVGEDDFFLGVWRGDGSGQGRAECGGGGEGDGRRRGRSGVWRRERKNFFFGGRRCGVVCGPENKVGERGDGVVVFGARGGRRRRRFGVGEGKSRFSFLVFLLLNLLIVNLFHYDSLC